MFDPSRPVSDPRRGVASETRDPSPVSPESPIVSTINNLDAAHERLCGRLNMLYDRLSGVMDNHPRAAGGVAVGEQIKESNESAVVKELRKHIEKVDRMAGTLDEILERLQV